MRVLKMLYVCVRARVCVRERDRERERKKESGFVCVSAFYIQCYVCVRLKMYSYVRLIVCVHVQTNCSKQAHGTCCPSTRLMHMCVMITCSLDTNDKPLISLLYLSRLYLWRLYVYM